MSRNGLAHWQRPGLREGQENDTATSCPNDRVSENDADDDHTHSTLLDLNHFLFT